MGSLGWKVWTTVYHCNSIYTIMSSQLPFPRSEKNISLHNFRPSSKFKKKSHNPCKHPCVSIQTPLCIHINTSVFLRLILPTLKLLPQHQSNDDPVGASQLGSSTRTFKARCLCPRFWPPHGSMWRKNLGITMMRTCLCTNVCMSVCMHACMHVCMYVYYTCIHVFTYVCR